MKGDVIKFRGGYKYSLWETYRVLTDIRGHEVKHRLFELTEDGWLTIFEDYPWDGASGPTLDTSNSMRASLVHDALAEMMRMGKLPHDPCFHLANLEFRKILLEDGMSGWRSGIWYRAVNDIASEYAAVQPERIKLAP